MLQDVKTFKHQDVKTSSQLRLASHLSDFGLQVVGVLHQRGELSGLDKKICESDRYE